jgi:hypothetical protein
VSTPVDVRGAADFEALLHQRVPGYLPGWSPEPGGPGSALLAIAGRMSAVVADRLNRAPTKNMLAFLDMLGISLLPAQPARAPVKFTLRPGLGDARAPAGTQVGASVAGVDGPLIFETERDIALAAANLAEVATVLPGSDQWACHTRDYSAQRPFTLFDGLQPTGHELYLAHDVHFALQGRCEVLVQLEVAASGARRIETFWEYWDGDGWRPFAPFVGATTASDSDSIDGTNGLTRSGTVVLRVDGAAAKRRVVNWVDSYWIRARCAGALTPDYAAHLPTVDRILVGSVVAPPIGSITLTQGLVLGGGIPPEEWKPMKTLQLLACYPLSLSSDPTTASATITQLGVPEETAHVDTRTLSGGYAELGPVPAAAEGRYALTVRIDGFTSGATTVQMKNGSPSLQALLGYSFVDRRPDKGAASGLPLDLTKPFYPFGASPQPGAACYLMLNDALSKPGAKVTIITEKSDTGLSDSTATTPLLPRVDAQYFDGEQWQQLAVDGLKPEAFTDGDTLRFTVPGDCAPTPVNNVDGYWIRFRIVSGTYGQTRAITIPKTATFNTRETISPVVGALRYAYYYHSAMQAPTACHTCNDFSWADHTASVPTRGTPFAPFTLGADPTPAVYFGFDAELPADVLSLYLDIAETEGQESGPALAWECFDDGDWRAISVEDETAALALPGAVRIAYPGVRALASRHGVQIAPDTVRPTDVTVSGQLRAGDVVTVGDDSGSELAVIATVENGLITFTKPTAKSYPRASVSKTGPARFGTPRAAWIRARLRSDGEPPSRTVNGAHLNTAWADNVQTRRDEVLGTSDGNPNQTVALGYSPVLPGERIEVLEVSGPRAAVDLADVRDDVLAHGGSEDDLRTVTDPAGAVTQVWVRWAPQRNLYFSGPTDRHYTIERSQGLVFFGDDRHGRIPPTTTDGIRASYYRSGGGRVGNVLAGAINQLLSGIPAGSVINIGPADGGADAETPSAVLARGPASVAARGQALTAADYEVLAREASPAVAFARALPATDPTGRPRAGFVRLIVMPASADPRPIPSFGLRRQVENYLRRRCPASMAGQIYVAAPDYQPVGVLAEIVPIDLDAAGPTIDAVLAAVGTFLHPLTGGPEGTGWALGRDVYRSDLARVIGGVTGVDHVRTLELLLDGTALGQVVPVATDRIVVAGDLTVRLTGEE